MENESNGEADIPFADVPKISETLGRLQKELQDLKSATEHIEESQEAAEEAVDAAERVRSATGELTSSTESLVERIEKVNFPRRFGALEDLIEDLEKTIYEAHNTRDRKREEMEERLTEQMEQIEFLAQEAVVTSIIIGIVLAVIVYLF